MIKSIWFLLLTITLFSNVFSQGRGIDEASYNQEIRKASEYRLKENYRARQISEFCEGDKCTWRPSNISVIEYDNPKKMRSYLIDTQRGQTEPSAEFIHIEGKIFAKRNNTGWILEEPRKSTRSSPPSETISIEHYDLGVEREGVNPMRVFLRVSRFRQVGDDFASGYLQELD